MRDILPLITAADTGNWPASAPRRRMLRRRMHAARIGARARSSRAEPAAARSVRARRADADPGCLERDGRPNADGLYHIAERKHEWLTRSGSGMDPTMMMGCVCTSAPFRHVGHVEKNI